MKWEMGFLVFTCLMKLSAELEYAVEMARWEIRKHENIYKAWLAISNLYQP